MNMHEMHAVFRTLGQQMGMQLIRGILPESIDVFLNEAINEKVRSTVMNNVATQFNDRVAIQDTSISPINSIRTLVKKTSLSINPISNNQDDFYTVLTVVSRVMFYTSFGIKYPNNKKRIGVRFIEGDKLNDTRGDYCNRESWDAPILSMFTDSQNREYIELYTGSDTKIPNILEITYIELPAIVKFNGDIELCINCNLPDYIHNEIVEIAVNKFFNSVGHTSKPVTRN